MKSKAGTRVVASSLSEPARRSLTLGRKLLLSLLSLGLFVALLAAIEGGLALFGVAENELYDDPFVGFTPGLRVFVEHQLESGEVGLKTHPSKLAFFNHQEFPRRKAAGSYRVFVLGGSTAAGRPYDDRVSFSRWLERYLDAAAPEGQHEVINAGAISYASYRVVLLMKELAHYSPDLFVVYTGHNEFLEERSYPRLGQQRPLFMRFRLALSRYRLAALARRALRGSEDPAETTLADEVQTRLDVWTGLQGFQRDEKLADSIAEHFAYNLELMVAIARDSGADLILIKPASNLKDFSPFKSEHRADLGAGDSERFDAALNEARERLAAGEVQDAAVILEEAATLDPEFAELHYLRGRAYFEQREYEAAGQAFEQARELDVAPLRARRRLIELIEEAAARHRLPLVDLPAILQADAAVQLGHTLLGEEYFLDHVHPRIEVHSRLATELLARLVESGKIAGELPSATTQNEIYEDVLDSLDRIYYTRRDLNLAKVLGWAGKLEEAEAPLLRAAAELEGDPDLHLTLGTLWQKLGRLPQAAEELERAVALDPASASAHFNLGVVYGRLGRLAAGIAALEEAVALRRDYGEAYFNLGVLHRRSGDAEAAIGALERALQLRGEAEVHAALGLAYRLGERSDEAIAALRRSIDLDARAVSYRIDLAVTQARSGQLDEALATLRGAAAIGPSSAEVHYNLGLVHTQRGTLEEARKAYHEAVALDPGHSVALNNLGILYARTGELDLAVELLERAVQRDPDYAEAFLNLGVVHDQAGRGAAAIRAVQRSLELRPDDPRIHLALGLLYVASGRPEAATPHLERAREAGLRTSPDA